MGVTLERALHAASPSAHLHDQLSMGRHQLLAAARLGNDRPPVCSSNQTHGSGRTQREDTGTWDGVEKATSGGLEQLQLLLQDLATKLASITTISLQIEPLKK